MPLQTVVDSLDGVPEAIRDAYTEKDGKFHLVNVEGFVPKSRLDEFRNNNIEANKALEALRAQFDGVDPEKFREYAARDQQIREKKLIDAGKVDELIAERVTAMRNEHDKVLKGITSERDATKAQLEGLLIDGALRDAAGKAGVLPSAVEDLLLRGRSTFRLQDGKAKAFQGDREIFGKEGEALSIDEWVSGLAERAPHLFAPSKGGGAPANNQPGHTGGKTMTRAQFDKLSPAERYSAARTFKIVD